MCPWTPKSAFFLPQVGPIVAPTSTPATAIRGKLDRKQRLQIGRSEMTKATLSRRRTRKRHGREKATIDHLVRILYSGAEKRGTTHSPMTASGLSVEEQVRKEWHPGLGGLALF